jgi:hypothetical protein
MQDLILFPYTIPLLLLFLRLKKVGKVQAETSHTGQASGLFSSALRRSSSV